MRLGRAIRARYPDVGREHLGNDAKAGLVLGVESVPDGLASGLLAGVNPVAGLYAYLFGMVGASFFTSASFMAVQATGAMAIIVADVDLAGRPDPARSLFTLSVVTGVVMVVAGLLKLGSIMRFVSKAVMTGFIAAVGINIVLGQLNTFTGYEAAGRNRVARAFDLVTHFWKIDVATTAVGAVTVVLIVALRRTRLDALGLVVAVIAGSALAAALNAHGAEGADRQGHRGPAPVTAVAQGAGAARSARFHHPGAVARVRGPRAGRGGVRGDPEPRRQLFGLLP